MLFVTCKKKQECPVFWGYLVPHTFNFIVKTNGMRLPDSILNNLRLFYLSDNSRQYVSDFGRAGSDGYNLGAMLTRDIGLKSGNNNIKDYYLEYPGGSIDTLFVDYRHYTACEADTSKCGCIYPLYAVKYKGAAAPIDTSIHQIQVFLFNK